MNKKFCLDCQIIIPTNLFGKPQGIEYQDGYRCQDCARKKTKLGEKNNDF